MPKSNDFNSISKKAYFSIARAIEEDMGIVGVAGHYKLFEVEKGKCLGEHYKCLALNSSAEGLSKEVGSDPENCVGSSLHQHWQELKKLNPELENVELKDDSFATLWGTVLLVLQDTNVSDINHIQQRKFENFSDEEKKNYTNLRKELAALQGYDPEAREMLLLYDVDSGNSTETLTHMRDHLKAKADKTPKFEP